MLPCFAVSAARHRAWGSEWCPGVEEEAGHQEGLICEAGIPARGSGSDRLAGEAPAALGSGLKQAAAACAVWPPPLTPGLLQRPRLLGLLLLLLFCLAPLSLPVPTWVIQVRVTATPPLAGSLQAVLPPW